MTKIVSHPTAAPTRVSAPRAAENAPIESRPPVRVADKVDVSRTASELSAAAEAAPPAGVSPARVAELKTQIESGTYTVDPKALATAIVDRELPE